MRKNNRRTHTKPNRTHANTTPNRQQMPKQKRKGKNKMNEAILYYQTKINLNTKTATGKIEKITRKTKKQILEKVHTEWNKLQKIIIKTANT